MKQTGVFPDAAENSQSQSFVPAFELPDITEILYNMMPKSFRCISVCGQVSLAGLGEEDVMAKDNTEKHSVGKDSTGKHHGKGKNSTGKHVMLAVDCGTQSLRTILFTEDGLIAGKAKIEYAPYTSPEPGWAEQDAEIFYQSLLQGCSILKKEHPHEFAAVQGIGITGQRDTMINLGEDGKPLRPAISWLDTRAAQGSYAPNPLMRTAYRAVGKMEVIRKKMSDGACNWIRENQPDIWERTWKYVQVSGYLNYCLTGEVKDSIASMVGHIPIDYRRRAWSRRGALLDKMFPVEQDKRYELTEPGTIIGKVSLKAAAETGLREGTPVVACGSDKSCETLGMGAVDSTLASLSFGTTATVEVPAHRYFSPLPFMPAYCAAIPGMWVPEVEIFRGYWMLRWFSDELGHREQEEAKRTGMIPEKVLDKLLDADPPGGYGLMLQPYWGASLKDPYSKGSIIGFGDIHRRSSIYRAIIEGLGYALREGLESIERRGKIHASRLAVSGGGSQSDNICQITANIIGRPLLRGETYETSALGAAMVTAVGLGIHPSYTEAVRRMLRYGRTFSPDERYSDLYRRLYEVYKKIYPRMKGIYADIQEITGYPEKNGGPQRKS